MAEVNFDGVVASGQCNGRSRENVRDRRVWKLVSDIPLIWHVVDM